MTIKQIATNAPDGIYYDMDEDIYHALPRLSASGIKHLSASSMDFWSRSWMNKNRKHRKSEAFDIGRAYHKRILEGYDAFAECYAPEFDVSAYPDALVTKEQIENVARDLGVKITGTKSVLIARIIDAGYDGDILDVLREQHAKDYYGREFLPYDLWNEINRAATYIEAQPNNPFKNGHPEVSLLWTDDVTGVPMKARFDYLVDGAIIDLKTFSNSNGLSVDKAIMRNIASYQYTTQAVVYLDGYKKHFGKDANFLFVFQQTGPAMLAKGKVFKEGVAFDVAQKNYRDGVAKFAYYYRKFGEEPWLDDLYITAMQDEDYPLWMFD